MAFASGLIKNSFNVKLIVPSFKGSETMIDFPRDKIINVYNGNNKILSFLKRMYCIFNATHEHYKSNSVLIIEMGYLGGILALGGFSNFIVDFHGLFFDELKRMDFRWFFPKKLYIKLIYYLERTAAKKSKKIITVSNSMSNFLIDNWEISPDKIAIIPNGYFSEKVRIIEENKTNEKEGVVTFVGRIEQWANIDKIIHAANLLREEEELMFYIVGDGPLEYIKSLKKLVHDQKLTNVIFTGSMPLFEAYDMIKRSQILLLPFPKLLCTEVSCPIKVLEYMSFGKSMVLDNVSDISKLLGERNAALVSNPENEADFAENISILIKDKDLRSQIGINAKKISQDYDWNIQTKKLIDLIA